MTKITYHKSHIETHFIGLHLCNIKYILYFCTHLLLLILLGITGSYLSIMGQRQGTLWTGRQFIAGLTY